MTQNDTEQQDAGIDSVLDAIEDQNVSEHLRLHMQDGETAEDAIQRLAQALPSPASWECVACGREIDDLADADWQASRLKVERSDFRRTDLYCSPSCIIDAFGASWGSTEAEADD